MGRSHLRFVALAAMMLTSGRGAAPLSGRRLDIQARESTLQCDFTGRRFKPQEVLLYLPPRPLCQVTGDTGVESKRVPETFMDLTPAELAKEVHELKHLTSADDQAMLPMILQRVGETVVDFFDNFSNTTCLERISSTVDTIPQVIPLHYDGRFNYVALIRPGQKEALLQEFRTDSKGEPGKLGGAVVTSGFVSLISHFRPVYQGDSRFRYLGRELVKGLNTYVLAFAQRPGVARQAEYVKFSDKAGFVLVQGVAWIDPVSFRVLRLRTEIQQPELNVGLSKETTEVEYSRVTFKQGLKTLWLPREVTVSGQLGQYVFSNQHRYSQYRFFIVEAGEKQENPDATPK
ncbi:MAG: hypothetical protein ACLQVM_04170 [Terriglobia bacterium]